MRIRALRSIGIALLVLAGLGPAPVVVSAQDQPPTVDAMYADAVAKETAVRTALGDDHPDPSVLKAVRSVVSSFEAIVRLNPASGFCDDALWRAGLTSIEAFNKLGDAHDKDAGLRLLRSLAARYPTSKLAKHVPDVIATLGTADPPSASARPIARSEPVAPSETVASGFSRTNLSTIKNIRRAVLPDLVRITIELEAEVPFHEERLDNPSRVFVDLAGTRAVPALTDRTLRFDDGTDLGKQIRIGRHPDNTTRIVVEAAGMSSYSVYPLYDPYRLVIDCVPAPVARGQPPTLASRSIRDDWTGTISPRPSQIIDALRSALADPEPLPSRPTTTGVAPERNIAGGFSIARQLGLRVSRIVIDPGHGGHDPGAEGKGITESELVLDVALRLERLLTKVLDTEVILTRRTDDFVSLQERTAIANREGADLFLSIHANASSNPQARGVETYFLNFAQNLSSAAVAARENAASGQAMGSLPDLLKTIALNNKLDESRDLATYVQRGVIESLRGTNKTVKDLGVKQAPFMVLIGAAMPSVLAEISFVTNSADVKLLKQPAYRQRIAEALFSAVRRYQTSLKSESLTASQN